jgi:hypothetical protein
MRAPCARILAECAVVPIAVVPITTARASGAAMSTLALPGTAAALTARLHPLVRAAPPFSMSQARRR